MDRPPVDVLIGTVRVFGEGSSSESEVTLVSLDESEESETMGAWRDCRG